MASHVTENTLPAASTLPAAVVEAAPPEQPAVASGESQSGWMVLLRIVVYLILLPGAILFAVRYLFDAFG